MIDSFIRRCFPLNRISEMPNRSVPIAVIIVIAVALAPIQAQTTAAKPSTKRSATAAARPGREVTIKETFEPAFAIEPLAHKIEGRAGDVIGFKFKIQSSNRPAKVEVAAIGLRQEMNGQILHVENSEKTDAIKLMTPSSMNLIANTPATIEGVVRMPKGDAKYHSLGILVRDVGLADEIKPKFNPDGSQQTQAGIRFITQYVLRLDLEVTGVRGEYGNQLVVEDVKMTSFEGRPQLQAMVFNPSDTTFEFELRGQLRSSPSDRSMKPLRMVMPVRKPVQDETRYVGRILPKTRLRMEELLPEAIGGGNYEADMELLFGGKVVNRKTLPLEINALDYPAQEVLIAEVDHGLQVSPAQIELSKVRGGSRRITMLLKNNSRETKTIHLKAIGNNDLEIGAVLIQPNEVQLPAASSRKIALTLRTQPSDARAVEYGYVLVEAGSSERDYIVSRQLPLAVILDDIPEPEISMSPLQWDPSNPYPCFRTQLENTGQSHLALQSRLTITDESGRRTSIPGGFGRWLMPQSATTLDFRLEAALMPGQYKLRCEVQRQSEPLVLEQVFTVTDLENASASVN